MQPKTAHFDQQHSGDSPAASVSDRSAVTGAMKAEAERLGFVLTGVCPAVTPTGIARLQEWIDLGYAGEMQYLANRKEAYEHPSHILSGARSLLMLALPYRTDEPPALEPGQAHISRYAWGTADYHDVIHERLKQLAKLLGELVPGAAARGVVDSAPLLEREYAQKAGLGWIGKHTLLLNRQAGSYFFLAALLTDVELDYDEAHATDHCGTCTACLDACPTQAFPQPGVLDATRCISYLTIELRGSIPVDLRSGIGDWLFGCDVCQDVCPWNRKSPKTPEPAFQPAEQPVDAVQLLQLDDDGFRKRFRQTPLWRSKRRGILRNAAIVLGNQRRAETVPALVQGLGDSEPLIRGACVWALGQIASDAALAGLMARKAEEADQDVLREIDLALQSGRVSTISGDQAASSHSP